jgi:hypothetical protein
MHVLDNGEDITFTVSHNARAMAHARPARFRRAAAQAQSPVRVKTSVFRKLNSSKGANCVQSIRPVRPHRDHF